MAIVEIRFVGRDDTSQTARQVAGAVREIGPAASESAGGMRGLLGSFADLTIVAGPVFGAIQGGFQASIGAGLNFNNQMEQTTAKLNAFTGSGEETAKILEMIKTRAAATPFEFSAMAEAATALMPAAKQSGMALEDLVAQAEILAASNPAEGLEGAAFALKEALSGDFTSIIERFNLPRSRLKELREQGVPDIEAVKIAMGELGLSSQLVTNLAGTMEGRWSTFKDTLVNVAATATKPIFDLMSGSLAKVNDFLVVNQPLLEQVGGTIAGVMTQAVQGAQAAWVQWGPQLVTVAGQLQGAIGPAITFVSGLLSGEGTSSLGAWGAAFSTAQGLVTGVLGAIQGLIGAVLPVITTFWSQHGGEIVSFAMSAWTQIGTIVTTTLQIIQGIVIPILTGIAAFISSHGAEIQGVLTLAWGQIQTIVGGALSLIQGILSTVLLAIQGDWSGAWATLQTTSAQFVTDIITAVEGGMKLLEGVISLAWEGIKTMAISLGGDMVAGIIDGVERAGSSLFGALKGLAEGALNAAKQALGISSPSRRAALELGRPMLQGWAGELDRGREVLGQSMRRLADAAIGAAAPAGGSASGTPAGAGPGRAGHQITINWYGSGDPGAARQDMRSLAYELARELDTVG